MNVVEKTAPVTKPVAAPATPKTVFQLKSWAETLNSIGALKLLGRLMLLQELIATFEVGGSVPFNAASRKAGVVKGNMVPSVIKMREEVAELPVKVERMLDVCEAELEARKSRDPGRTKDHVRVQFQAAGSRGVSPTTAAKRAAQQAKKAKRSAGGCNKQASKGGGGQQQTSKPKRK